MELGGAKVLFGLTINKLKYWIDCTKVGRNGLNWTEVDGINQIGTN